MSDHHADSTNHDSGTATQNGVLLVGGVLLCAVAVLSVILWRSSGQATAGLVTFLLFLAASAVGAFAGFLFGLPRSRFADRNAAGDAPNSTAPGASAYLANSNLIKVSDWLTTIVVGLTLVNLGAVVPAMQSFATALREPLGGAAYSGAVGLSVAILGGISAAMMSYMWTTMRGRQLWEDIEAEYRGRLVPDLKGLTVSQAAKVVATLPMAVDPGKLQPDDTIQDQDPAPGSTAPDGKIRVTG